MVAGRRDQPQLRYTVAGTFFSAIEDSDLLLIDASGQQQIVDRVPGYSAAMRAGLQKHAAAKDLRIVKALSASAEERYLQLRGPRSFQ